MDYAGRVRKGVSLSVIGASAALVVLLVYGVATQATDNSIDEAVANGERPEAASAELPVLGNSVEGSLADYRGKVVVLNFWASWCPPCVDEAPLLERAHRSIEDRGATVLGVNYKDVPEDALGFVRDHEISFPSLRDGDGEYGEHFATRGLPETFVIDRRGRIAALRRGPVDERWLEDTLSALLGKGG
jgi:cytochrome c biogenesis protein CcmG/thiol:disulfide interchange protein DsbE